MTNAKHTVLYTGVTSDPKGRVWQQKEKVVEGITKKYHVDMLIYYKVTGDVLSAIAREKQIKAGSQGKRAS